MATTTTPLPPLPEKLNVLNWHEGMTQLEWDDAAHHIVGWLCFDNPELFAKAVATARKTVEGDRARRASRYQP